MRKSPDALLLRTVTGSFSVGTVWAVGGSILTHQCVYFSAFTVSGVEPLKYNKPATKKHYGKNIPHNITQENSWAKNCDWLVTDLSWRILFSDWGLKNTDAWTVFSRAVIQNAMVFVFAIFSAGLHFLLINNLFSWYICTAAEGIYPNITRQVRLIWEGIIASGVLCFCLYVSF